MDTYSVLGFAVGVLVVLLIVLVVKKVSNKNQNCEYDERQLLARSTAYKYSFFTLLIYMALSAMLYCMEIKWATLDVQMILGIILSVAVFAGICIFKDAYFTYDGKNMKSFLVLACFCGPLNLILFFTDLFGGEELLTNGMLNNNIMSLLYGLLFTAIIIMIVIKRVISKRTVEDEE